MKFYNKERQWYPTYGEIDWRAMLLTKLAVENETLDDMTIWFDSEDGLDIECTQETCDIFVSKASDDSDAILVLDPRDGMRYSWYRDQIGDETFDRLSQNIQGVGAAAVHFTMFPTEEVAEVWLNRKQGDLSQADFVPEAWIRT